jgi:restriction endonuclease S subunit
MFGDVFHGSEKYHKQTIATLIDERIQKVGKVYGETDLIKYIDISSIDNGRNEIFQYTDYVVEKAPSRAQQVVSVGDVLVSTVRPNLKNVAVIREQYDNLIASTGFCVLRPSDKTNAEYIFAIIRTDDFAEYLARRAKGANYPAVNASDIKEFEVPLPPLDLQNRFADFVRQADKSKVVAWKAAGNLLCVV